MTDMYSLESRQVLISQWGSPATIIGNQQVAVPGLASRMRLEEI